MHEAAPAAGEAGPMTLRLPCHARAFPLLAGALSITVLAARAPHPLLVWNASASAPIGLYAVSAPHNLARGDMVIARLPRRFGRLAAARYYLPQGVLLVKRVAAVPGDHFCALGQALTLPDGRSVVRLSRDHSGRTMPSWTGCGRLRPARYLLIMTGAPLSFDGRYFGPTPSRDIVGKARLLWPR